jgi:hypothetical protein
MVEEDHLADVVELQGDVEMLPEGFSPGAMLPGLRPERCAGEDDVVVVVVQPPPVHVPGDVVGQAVVHAAEQERLGVRRAGGPSITRRAESEHGSREPRQCSLGHVGTSREDALYSKRPRSRLS